VLDDIRTVSYSVCLSLMLELLRMLQYKLGVWVSIWYEDEEKKGGNAMLDRI